MDDKNLTKKVFEKLKKQGFTQVQVLAGGISAWQQNNLPLVKGK